MKESKHCRELNMTVETWPLPSFLFFFPPSCYFSQIYKAQRVFERNKKFPFHLRLSERLQAVEGRNRYKSTHKIVAKLYKNILHPLLKNRTLLEAIYFPSQKGVQY